MLSVTNVPPHKALTFLILIAYVKGLTQTSAIGQPLLTFMIRHFGGMSVAFMYRSGIRGLGFVEFDPARGEGSRRPAE